jgi:hypothetical protein
MDQVGFEPTTSASHQSCVTGCFLFVVDAAFVVVIGSAEILGYKNLYTT